MPEKLDIGKVAVKGFVFGALSQIGVAAGTWLLLKFHQFRDPAIAFLHHLAPTTEEVVTISICLFAVVVFNLLFLFVVSYRNARRRVELARRSDELEQRRIELINTKLADLKSGKIGAGSLTIEEMYILRDKLPKQPWKYEKENEARSQAALDQICERP